MNNINLKLSEQAVSAPRKIFLCFLNLLRINVLKKKYVFKVSQLKNVG